MDGSTLAAASGLRSRMQSLDLLANNLANATTSGFKRDQEFYGLFNSIDSEDSTMDGPNSTMPMIERQWIDFSPGEIQTTGNPFNVALNGTGFLAADGPNGQVYTRNGNIQLLSSGELATSEGYPLRNVGGGAIRLTSSKPFTISSTGLVQQGGQTLGQLEVVTFKSTDPLRKLSGALFQNTDPKNAPTKATNVEVQQGKLEGSNVPVAEAAMKLVGVMRQFEMLQKAVGMNSDMDSKSIQEVARVGS